MIDEQKLKEWLSARIKDESEGIKLLEEYPRARAMCFGAREAYVHVLDFIEGRLDD